MDQYLAELEDHADRIQTKGERAHKLVADRGDRTIDDQDVVLGWYYHGYADGLRHAVERVRAESADLAWARLDDTGGELIEDGSPRPVVHVDTTTRDDHAAGRAPFADWAQRSRELHQAAQQAEAGF